MTSPGGGGHNDINLAALWIPVMPETSHMGEEMRKAGGEAKKQFEQGFNSGNSPENIGQSFGSKLTASIGKEMGNFELPFGMSNMFEKFGNSVDKNVVEKLKGQASQALDQYREKYEALTAAQERAVAAETQINIAREGGFNKASIMLPLIQEQSIATRELETAHTNAGAALGNYNEKTSALSDVTKKASDSSAMFAGMMGGAVVAGVQSVVSGIESFYEHMIEGVVEGFKIGIESAKEFADKMIELGETYEHMGIQITEFSTLAGEEFKKTEEAAKQVFSTLDVAGKDVGKTMAQFSSILGVSGDSIKQLVGHVTDLQGRYTSLKATDLASIFVAFKTPVQETDTALASLLQSARGSGQDLGQFASALQGNVALTLSEANLSLGQAGAFMGDLMKMGEPGRQAMTGMTSAMKEFKAEGISFGDGMKLAGETLKQLGDTAEGQGLAEKLFGTRNWIVAKNAVEDYMNVVAQGPNAFNASSASVDDFIQRTRILQNEWEIVKHKAQEAFLPMGEEAVKLAGTGLDRLVGFINSHMDTIKHDVIQGGLVFIGFAAQLQQLAAGTLEFFGPVINGVDSLMSVAISSLGTFAHVTGEILSNIPGFTDIGNGMIDAGKAAEGFGVSLDKINVGDKMTKLAEWIKQHPIDVKTAGDAWIQFGENVGSGMDSANEAVGKSNSWFANGSPTIGPGGAPGQAPIGGLGGAPSGFSIGGTGSAGPVSHVADWEAIAAKEGGGQWNITYTTGVPEGGGLQIKPETWQQYGGLADAPKPYMATKEQQEDIAERILNGWNGIAGQGPGAWPATYVEKKALGGAPGSSMGRLVTQGGGSGDDVAALLKRGEYVWDTETMDKFGWLVTALHQGTTGFGQGGDVGGVSQVIWSDLEDPTVQAASGDAGVGVLYGSIVSGGPGSPYSNETNSGGNGFAGHHGHVHTTFNADPFTGQPYTQVPAGTNTAAGEWSAFPPWVKRLGDMYGLDAKTYAGHQEWNGANHGIDWWPRGKLDMSGKSYTHQDDAALSNFAAAAMAVGSGRMQGFAQGAGSGGADSYGGLGSTPGGKNGGLYPGLPGQYGGSGTYGGETYDQQVQAAQNVQSAKDRQSDLDWQVGQHQKRVDDLNAELGKGDPNANKPGLLPGTTYAETPAEQKAWADKQKSLNDQLSTATHDLTVALRDQSEQGGKVTEAERKQIEAANKKPTGTQAGGNKDAQSLGSGLLQGIGQELGLGDVLGKSPLDWGIVKLAEGLFSYANGLGDAIFGKTNSGGGLFGGTPGGSQGLGDGLANGLLGSIGIKLPSAAISGAPNVIPGTPTPFGTGGPLPGPPQPGIVNNDNSINISPNVDAQAVLGPVQAQQNSYNSQAYQYAGGTPQQ